MKRYPLVILTCLILLISGCGAGIYNSSDQTHGDGHEVPSAEREIFAMDTYMRIACYGERCEEAADAAAAEIQRLDALLSVGNPTSEIYAVNQNGGGAVSADTDTMLRKSLDLCNETGGAFDITVFPLMELWGFTSGNFAVPKESDLREALSKVGSGKLSYDDSSRQIKLADGQGIDLGGIAKGYTSNRLMEIFKEYGLVSGMLSLGGNVQLYNAKPDGSLWRIGIQDPFAGDEGGTLMGVVTAKDCAVITSGAYERFFTDENGVRYHHIIDPATGYPAENGLASVTIVSENGMLADGLSTACYVMGLDEAARLWRTSKEEFDMILMTDDKNVYITAPLKDSFTTDYPLHIIEKDLVG